jgi:hypothetical protein
MLREMIELESSVCDKPQDRNADYISRVSHEERIRFQ